MHSYLRHSPVLARLLKNVHMRRCAQHSQQRRAEKYASFPIIARALQPAIFEQTVKKHFFKILIM